MNDLIPQPEPPRVTPTPARKPRRSRSAQACSLQIEPLPSSPDSQTTSATAPASHAVQEDEAMLARLGHGAQYCQQIEAQLARYAGPELDAIMKLHRLIILKLSTQADAKPQLWDVVKDLMKPVMDWARLQEQQKEREFTEKKYRDHLEAEKAETAAKDDPAAALKPETLEKIEFELKLL